MRQPLVYQLGVLVRKVVHQYRVTGDDAKTTARDDIISFAGLFDRVLTIGEAV